MSEKNRPQLSHEGLLRHFYAKKWFLLGFTILVAVLAIFYALNLQKRYKSTALFLPPQSKGQGGLLSSLEGLPFMGAFGGGQGKVDHFEVLKSYFHRPDNLWKIIDEFNLREYYKLEEAYKVDVETAFLENLHIGHDKISGIARVTFHDTKPEMASRVTNSVLKLLREISKESLITENQKKVEFLEKRLNEIRIELRLAESKLIEFQNQAGLLEVRSQAKSTLEVLALLQNQILVNRVGLKVKRKMGLSDQHPVVKDLEEKNKELSLQLKEISQGSPLNEGATLIPINKLPGMSLELERLMREKQLQLEIFKVVSKEFELAKMEAAKDQDLVEVIYWGRVPEVHYFPKKKLVVIGATALGSILAVLIILMQYLFWIFQGIIQEDEVFVQE